MEGTSHAHFLLFILFSFALLLFVLPIFQLVRIRANNLRCLWYANFVQNCVDIQKLKEQIGVDRSGQNLIDHGAQEKHDRRIEARTGKIYSVCSLHPEIVDQQRIDHVSIYLAQDVLIFKISHHQSKLTMLHRFGFCTELPFSSRTFRNKPATQHETIEITNHCCQVFAVRAFSLKKADLPRPQLVKIDTSPHQISGVSSKGIRHCKTLALTQSF